MEADEKTLLSPVIEKFKFKLEDYFFNRWTALKLSCLNGKHEYRSHGNNVFAAPNRLCIVNDQLFIRMATTEEIRKAFVAPAPTPSSSPVPTLTAPQQEMLSAFSLESGMNFEWSQK